MKKTIKKLLGLVLTLVMCLALAPTQMAKAAEDFIPLPQYTSETAVVTEVKVDGNYAKITYDDGFVEEHMYDMDFETGDWVIFVTLWPVGGEPEYLRYNVDEMPDTLIQVGMTVYDATPIAEETTPEYPFYPVPQAKIDSTITSVKYNTVNGMVEIEYANGMFEYQAAYDGIVQCTVFDEEGNSIEFAMYAVEDQADTLIKAGDMHEGAVEGEVATDDEENTGATTGTNTNINISVDDVDDSTMSDETVKNAYLGTWDGTCIFTEDSVSIDYYDYDTANVFLYESGWKFKEAKILEGVITCEDDYYDKVEGGIEPTTKVKALVFEADNGDVFTMYRGFNWYRGYRCLKVDIKFAADGAEKTVECMERWIGWEENEYAIYPVALRITDALKGAVDGTVKAGKLIAPDVEGYYEEEDTTDVSDTTEEPKEETPKTEEPKEEVKEETPKTEGPVKEDTKEEVKEDTTKEDKEAVSKTKDGRPVYENEQVYVVQKGDCLYAIAKKLLGDGKRYTELFTRNGDIVEKATLIYPGQEIIVPAK